LTGKRPIPWTASHANENRLINAFLNKHNPKNASSVRKIMGRSFEQEIGDPSKAREGKINVAPTIVGGFLAKPFQICWQVRKKRPFIYLFLIIIVKC
jgi:hypothetical protein